MFEDKRKLWNVLIIAACILLGLNFSLQWEHSKRIVALESKVVGKTAAGFHQDDWNKNRQWIEDNFSSLRILFETHEEWGALKQQITEHRLTELEHAISE